MTCLSVFSPSERERYLEIEVKKEKLSVSLDCVEMKFQRVCISINGFCILFTEPTSYLIQQNFH